MYNTMVIRMDYSLTHTLKLELVLLNQKYHGGLGNKGSSHLIQHKIYLSMKTRKRGKPHGNKTSPKKGT